MKTSEALRKSGDVLRERGWCQEVLETEDGRVCLRGATGLGGGGSPSATESSEVIDLVRTVIDRDGDTVSWNDAAERTQADVEAVLDAAYVLALQEEGVEPEDVL